MQKYKFADLQNMLKYTFTHQYRETLREETS